jgi:hypothetical protein
MKKENMWIATPREINDVWRRTHIMVTIVKLQYSVVTVMPQITGDAIQ